MIAGHSQIWNAVWDGFNGSPENARKLNDLDLLIPVTFWLAPGNYLIGDARHRHRSGEDSPRFCKRIFGQSLRD